MRHRDVTFAIKEHLFVWPEQHEIDSGFESVPADPFRKIAFQPGCEERPFVASDRSQWVRGSQQFHSRPALVKRRRQQSIVCYRAVPTHDYGMIARALKRVPIRSDDVVDARLRNLEVRTTTHSNELHCIR